MEAGARAVPGPSGLLARPGHKGRQQGRAQRLHSRRAPSCPGSLARRPSRIATSTCRAEPERPRDVPVSEVFGGDKIFSLRQGVFPVADDVARNDYGWFGRQGESPEMSSGGSGDRGSRPKGPRPFSSNRGVARKALIHFLVAGGAARNEFGRFRRQPVPPEGSHPISGDRWSCPEMSSAGSGGRRCRLTGLSLFWPTPALARSEIGHLG